MAFWGKCGSSVADGAPFCQQCGAPVAAAATSCATTSAPAPDSARPRLRADALIEVVDRHAEDSRDFEQTACADAVHAFFVFLHLLKGQAEQFAQSFLTHADQHPP